MYHGVHATGDGPIYRVGLALLDLDDPRIVPHRTDEWVFGPIEPYELTGDVGGRVPLRLDARRGDGPTAHVLRRRRHVIGLATARFSDVLARVLAAPTPA